MSFNMRKAMLTVIRKRLRPHFQATSNKYWYAYKATLEAHHRVPYGSDSIAAKMYLSCFTFHVELMRVIDVLEDQVHDRWERGQHHAMQGSCGIEIHVYADEFAILMNFGEIK